MSMLKSHRGRIILYCGRCGKVYDEWDALAKHQNYCWRKQVYNWVHEEILMLRYIPKVFLYGWKKRGIRMVSKCQN